MGRRHVARWALPRVVPLLTVSHLPTCVTGHAFSAAPRSFVPEVSVSLTTGGVIAIAVVIGVVFFWSVSADTPPQQLHSPHCHALFAG